MKVVAKTGREDIAVLYIGEMDGGKHIEFVESVQPPLPRERKWVLIVSTLFGCPVRCRFCDAGGHYNGTLSKEEIFAQIDYLIDRHYPDRHVPMEKFKIQFARMGEPALNPAVLDVLDEFPSRYRAPGFIPSLSTIAPRNAAPFFERLLEINRRHYRGRFQLQFSIHSTDPATRDWLMPVKKWDFHQIAEYGARFHADGGRKITLNFALAGNSVVDPAVLRRYFDPDRFLIKVTPVNPTYQAVSNGLESHVVPEREEYPALRGLEAVGYEVILSIGEWEENRIGSNCGQYLTHFRRQQQAIEGSYTYACEPA